MTFFSDGVTGMGGAPSVVSSFFGKDSKEFFLEAANGNDGNPGDTAALPKKTLASAYALVRDLKGDTLNLIASASSANLAAALAWTKSLSRLRGIGAPTHMNQRCRIGHSANFTPGITISGYGNCFQNVYFAYGRGNAGNLVAVQVSGARNYFENVHIGAPMHATEGAAAGFIALNLVGAQECTFRGCTIGISTIARAAANTLVSFSSGAGRILFEDCLFLSMSSAATPVMVKNAAVDGIVDWVRFKNCTFINFSANWATTLTAAITNAGGNSGAIILENPTFVGIDDIGAADNLLRTFVNGTQPTAATVGLSVNPAVS